MVEKAGVEPTYVRAIGQGWVAVDLPELEGVLIAYYAAVLRDDSWQVLNLLDKNTTIPDDAQLKVRGVMLHANGSVTADANYLVGRASVPKGEIEIAPAVLKTFQEILNARKH